MKYVKRFVAGVFVFALSAHYSVGDGFRNPPEGVDSLGRAGGRIVFGDGISAGSHNPANLADREKTQAGAGVAAVYGRRTFRPEHHEFTARSTDRWGYLPGAFLIKPSGDGRYTLGASLTSPYGRSASFDKDGPMGALGPYKVDLRTVNFNPAVGFSLGDRLSLGGGISLLWSDLDMRQVFPDLGAEGRFDADGIGYGFNVGLNWKIAERQRVALTYKSAVAVDYDGDVAISQVGGPELMRDDFSTDLTFPAVIALGYGIRATDTLRLEANIEWVEHSHFDSMDLDAGETISVMLPQSSIPADWRDNWTFGVGADWRVVPDWVVRAGYIYLQTPVPSRTMIPLVAEADQSVVSLGIGYTGGPHRLDMAYMIGLFDRRQVRENVNPDYEGSYHVKSHLMALGYSLAF